MERGMYIVYSSFYESYFEFTFFEQAFEAYLAWCDKYHEMPLYTRQEFGLMDADEFPGSSINHVLYHANMMGLDINANKCQINAE